jgi:hypothetical protein
MAKFTIRQLLMVIAVAAVCSLLIRTDWVAAVGFAAAIFYWTIAFKLFSDSACRRVNMVVRFIASLLAAVLMWFSVVDFSVSRDWCTECGEHRYIQEFRVCGIPIWTTYGEFHENVLGRFRTDLGFPCKNNFDRMHLVRAWGLLYCARPCSGGTCCLIGDPDYYSEDVSKLARQFASENPSEASALYKVIVEEMNYDAMHKFITRLKEQTIRAER